MSKLSDHRSGNHDEELKSGCPVCDAFLAYFIRFGETMPSELEQKAIAEAEADEEVADDWEEDEEGYLVAPLNYENREGDPAFNGAFNAW